MSKIYKVFVSSTFEDLQEERFIVMQDLLKSNCFPVGMELFPAANEKPLDLIKKEIDSCDFYICVIGGCYGSIDPSTGKSYTQMEYEYAIEQGKPAVAFLPKDPSNISSKKTENNPMAKILLEKFVKRIEAERLVDYWETPHNLGSVVKDSIANLKKDAPKGAGWVKNNKALSNDEDVPYENLLKYTRFDNGNIFIGYVKNGVPYGPGELLYPDGMRELGVFMNGNLSGQGEVIFPDGHRIIGMFSAEDRQITGYEIMITSDNSVFAGEFRDGKPVGYTRSLTQDGKIFIGEMQKYKIKNGKIWVTHNDEMRLEAIIKDGKVVK
ncbi:MAG: DUF4062 domain-containing protein [Oscillospiraceae bacterium]|jgi:hypothetical protein|nr:DUF4062 domain-containing protein [Oscillospiraceae bacterium]